MLQSRRSFLALAATSAAFAGLSRAVAQPALGYHNQVTGYGDLVADPAGLFDLPPGFSYSVISETGARMDDGLITPDKMDGMGCFPLGRDRVALVRNHENRPSELGRSAFGADGALAQGLAADRVFDRTAAGLPMAGGTTTVVYDLKSRRKLAEHLSLAGTSTNCAGGRTPEGSWLSCEETTDRRGASGGAQDHGWVFEVPARLRGVADPVPIKAMGRFRHEATATDPRTGVVYMTEDTHDGLIYRYLPNDRRRLHEGGRLQALGFRDPALDSRNWETVTWKPGDVRDAVWIDLDGVDSANNDLGQRGAARGAAKFARGEGLYFGRGELFIACTSGGATRNGQILRYTPSRQEGRPGEADAPGRLQLFVEPEDAAVMRMADNISVSPWGHLFVCEDKDKGQNQLKAVTPDGRVYAFGRNPKPATPVNTELCGVCFSPDGTTLFLNLYVPGKTLAITGPWARLRT